MADRPMSNSMLPEIEAILRRYFPGQDQFDRAIAHLGALIRRFTRTGSFRGGGTVTHNVEPNYARLCFALQEISDVAPWLIADGLERLERLPAYRASGQFPDADLEHYERGIVQLEQLQAIVSKMAAEHQPSSRKRPDPRSSWHWTAQVFAKTIEADLSAASAVIPTRNSAKSPTVSAVCELLALAGCHQNEDAVRKALVGKSQVH